MASKTTPKTPQDHKPKNGPRKVTIDGITVTVDPDDINDFQVLEYLARMNEEQDPVAAPLLFRKVVDADDYRRIMRHLADDKGRVDPERAITFMGELMAEMAPNS